MNAPSGYSEAAGGTMEEELREQLIQCLFTILGKDKLEKLKVTVGIQDEMEAVAGLLDFYIKSDGCGSPEDWIEAISAGETSQ